MDDRIQKSYQLVITGEIQQGNWLSKRSFITNAFPNYFKSCGVKRVTVLQADTFDDFRYWATTEGWKFHKVSNPNQCRLLTDGTVNSAIDFINDFYTNYLFLKGYVGCKPIIEIKQMDLDDISANPPLPFKKWMLIWRCLKSWS